ncbi:hypothetical protein [Bosea sp. (in: a-proteobacteria)]|uniref:hypothetical protein n=1 Tax=Bosea sp. (in: a-proteobacteria) TaxID=1871050 RepID=UPI003565056A
MSVTATMPIRYDAWVNRALGMVKLSEADAAALRMAQADMFARVLPAILLSNMLSSLLVALVLIFMAGCGFP